MVSSNIIGNHRFSAIQSLEIWENVMALSPRINPLECRIIRYLAMHCLTPEPLVSLADFPITGFHFPVLDRLWHVVVAAIKRSDWEFKNYLRPKDSQSLKRQLQDMVSKA